MGLKNYKPVRHEIPLQGNDPLSIRGLSLEDISALVQHHLPDIEALFELFERAGSMEDDAFRQIVVAAVNEAPGFVANVIAMASDEPDAAENAQELPGPVQVQALLKIGDLTFKDVGGIKKGMEDIAALLSRLKVDKTSLKRVSGKAG